MVGLRNLRSTIELHSRRRKDFLDAIPKRPDFWRAPAKISAGMACRPIQEFSLDIFLRSILRSGKIWLQNRAILRNALRKRNDELPSVSNDMQSSETLRNSLGLNYKSAALSGETDRCKIRNNMYTSGTDSLLFGRRRDAQIRHCGQNRVPSTPHTMVEKSGVGHTPKDWATAFLRWARPRVVGGPPFLLTAPASQI
jgi:hypothetical protein